VSELRLPLREEALTLSGADGQTLLLRQQGDAGRATSTLDLAFRSDSAIVISKDLAMTLKGQLNATSQLNIQYRQVNLMLIQGSAVFVLMKKLLSITPLVFLVVGCSSTRSVPGNHHYVREVVLSEKHSEDAFLGARLVQIAKDGTATIEVTETGERLTAAPGEYFVSGAYGTEGLQLLSASAEKNEARLVRAWAEIK